MEHAWVCMRPLRPCVLYIRLYDPNKNKIRLETLTLRRPGCGNTAPAPLCWFLPSRKFAESPRWAAAACLTSANNKITEEKDFYQGTSKGVYLYLYICMYIYIHIFRLKTWSSNDFRFCHLILYPSGSVRQGGLGWDWVHLLTDCKFKQDLVEEGRVRFPKSVRWCLPSINICLVKPRTDPVKSSLHVCKEGLECRHARSQMLHVQVFTDIYMSCLGQVSVCWCLYIL